MKKVAMIAPAEGKVTIPLKDGSQALPDRALLSLHQRMQATLNTGVLVSRLFNWLGEQLPVVGIEYIYPDEHIELRSGESRQHSAHYVLRLEQRYLGEITLSGSKRMAEGQLYVLEQAMGVFVHYLKNALDYLELEKVAFRDSLTSVMNRTALDELLPKEVDRAQRYDYELSVMMVDIDHFKEINDRVGHLGGDQVLCEVSRVMRTNLRSSDLIFRYGGDEFLVIMPSTNLAGARTAAGQIMTAVKERPVAANGREVEPRMSIGVVSRQLGESPDELLLRVDDALYDAKKTGRDCIC